MTRPPSAASSSPSQPDDPRPILAIKNVTKNYGHVRALHDVSLSVCPGEIVAVFGDNGAGKSTLLKVLCGLVNPDSGIVEMRGEPVRLTSIRDAEKFGVGVLHQDLALPPDLTVLESIYLGHEELARGWRRRLGILDRRAMAKRSAESLRALGISIPSVWVPVSLLSGGQRQAVAVARAEMWATTAILMDEPTAALGTKQSRIVTETIVAAAKRGLGLFVISHDIPRMLEAATTVIILRHGSVVWRRPASEVAIEDIVAAMVGTAGADHAA